MDNLLLVLFDLIADIELREHKKQHTRPNGVDFQTESERASDNRHFEHHKFPNATKLFNQCA